MVSASNSSACLWTVAILSWFMYKAKLGNADLSHADLTGADLRAGNLKGANLTGQI